ncbi:hypothetical protein [Streptacidiphilus sp. EB103A]|uniref:hypothetical protein n=1 Tax=Streptacidiphilus sp. EB103A TaxID=3156275 RepID=UPI0035194735
MNADDELLHRDSSGDALYAAPPRGRHGTLLYIHPTGESSVYLPTAAVDALRTALTDTGTAAATEDYPGELEHLRELRDAVAALNADATDDHPLTRLLAAHFLDPRSMAQIATSSA